MVRLVAYKGNWAANRYVTFVLPSTWPEREIQRDATGKPKFTADGQPLLVPLTTEQIEDCGWIKMPTRLGGGTRLDIQAEASMAMQVQLPNGTTRTEIRLNPIAAGRELFVRGATHPKAEHNLYDPESGEKIKLTREYLLAQGGDGFDEIDLEEGATWAISNLWDSINVTIEPEQASADPNGSATASSTSSPLSPPAANPSSTPAGSAGATRNASPGSATSPVPLPPGVAASLTPTSNP